MNKNAIKKFATEARRELISRVSQRALKYGISEKEVGNPNDDSVGGYLLSATEKKQRAALIAQIQEKGYKQVMEEVAYTWFNRFSALRFMEVNGYLPSRVRVFTDENNVFKPQILTEAIHMELDGLDMEKVYVYKEANDEDELYKYLLITQCNALNSVLPGMFQKIADYTELLFPDNLLREGSVIQQMIELIPEEDWKDAVQIIGWLYQYYNSEKKADVFAALKKNIKITKENIPAATQLFTPDWIVRYMVENSLGRLWVEGHPNDELKSQWKYYLEEAEQEPDVQAQLTSIRKEYAALTPDQLKVIDPCSGSGHILVYLFDVLMQIYESYGYTTREAVASIVENNLYGLDIDDRAAQLAYFAVMMKARQYDRRFFSRSIQPHVYAIVESNHVDSFALEYFCNGDAKLKKAMDTIISQLHDAKEYGSILTVTPQDWSALYARFAEIKEDIHISREAALRELLPLVQVAEALAQKYYTVVTNPPYMGGSGMGSNLTHFVRNKYPDTKSDLFSCFIERGFSFTNKQGFLSMITMESWMFLTSFEKLREKIVYSKNIINLVHMPYLGKGGTSLGINFGTAAFVLNNKPISKYNAQYDYIRYYENDDEGVPLAFPTINERYKAASMERFMVIPGIPIAYWKSDEIIHSFSKGNLDSELTFRQGMTTTNNEKYLRLWYEVDFGRIGFNFTKREDAAVSDYMWFPYQKGGEFRKWYGNNEYIVYYLNDGKELIELVTQKYPKISDPEFIIKNRNWYFKEGLTWSTLSSAAFGVRYCDGGYIFDAKGSMAFTLNSTNIKYYIALLNSYVATDYLDVLAPTMDFNIVGLKAIPFIKSEPDKICGIVDVCIALSKKDWNSFERAWDFQRHPLLRKVPTITKAFDQWQAECDERFNQLKANEEELNRIFIDIYGLQDELTPEVEDKDVTVRKADLGRDIRSFISYAVGCMFGRYSLDVDGLAYAGGEWDANKYASFAADKDNIIPICNDEYFEDDIVGLFVKFVKTVYGADTLDENLKFIADALGGKGQAKDVIRNYFMNDFYKDHCKMYQKRPIYWLFDSGKKNGFKALIYMHRYQPDTIARIRTDYVHEQQARYRTAIADLEQRIADASIRERVKLDKQLKTLNDQDTEIHTYEEKIHHLADQMISIDLDDGVKKNYAIFQDVLAKIK